MHSGNRSYKKALDFDVWAHCFLEYTHNSPRFYTDEFCVAADSILNKLHTTRKDMTINVAKTLFGSLLCDVMNQICMLQS